jgi:uncharacterized protein YutE (UPF0331/DUF86 family)
MTASKVKEKVVAAHAAWIREMVAALRALPLDNAVEFHSDRRNIAAAESYLRRALEALMDLGRHVLAKGYGVAAAEYREIPKRLSDVGALTEDEARLMGGLAGYRNRLVHFYHHVSDEELLEICRHRLGDVEGLLERFTAWLLAHPEKVDRSL